MTNNTMNLYQKVAKIKGEMSSMKFSKTGRNSFTKFNYFQLDDFEPTLEKLCSQYGVVTYFMFALDAARMVVVDADDPNQKIEVDSPVDVSFGKTSSKMQDIGAMQTYARRYLFMSFFGITESDFLDEVAGKDIPKSEDDVEHVTPDKDGSKKSDSNTDNRKTDTNADKKKSTAYQVWRRLLNMNGFDSKKPLENEENKASMEKARDVMRARYGKDNATQLSENQLADLNAYLDSLVTPENFVSDEIEP